MQIQLLGVRGSIPTPFENDAYRNKLKSILEVAAREKLSDPSDVDSFISSLPENLQYNFGGNTTCATVTSESGKQYIIDMGTGVRSFASKLMKGPAGKGEGKFHIFITHTHWDHIQSIPFFYPIYIPGNELNFHSPYDDLQERLEHQQKDFRFFPASLEKTPSDKKYHILKPGEVFQPEENLKIDCHPLKHPGGSFAYRFREGNKTFIFATDAEFTGESLEQMDEEHINFFRDADLLVLDSQYTLYEAFSKFDWGHTSYTMAVNCGIRWNVKKLVLTHHEPNYSDDILLQNFNDAIEHRDSMKTSSPEIFMAREGMIFDI